MPFLPDVFVIDVVRLLFLSATFFPELGAGNPDSVCGLAGGGAYPPAGVLIRYLNPEEEWAPPFLEGGSPPSGGERTFLWVGWVV